MISNDEFVSVRSETRLDGSEPVLSIAEPVKTARLVTRAATPVLKDIAPPAPIDGGGGITINAPKSPESSAEPVVASPSRSSAPTLTAPAPAPSVTTRVHVRDLTLYALGVIVFVLLALALVRDDSHN